jgi:hypothetical protein
MPYRLLDFYPDFDQQLPEKQHTQLEKAQRKEI